MLVVVGALAARAADLPSVEVLRQKNLSHLELQVAGQSIEVFLYAPDQKVEVIDSPYCGGNEGERSYSGSYTLISVVDSTAVSQLSLAAGHYFVEGHRHDGLRRVERFTPSDVFVIYQYGGCSVVWAEFFRVAPDGTIQLIEFVDQDGGVRTSTDTSPGEESGNDGSELTLCPYNNVFGLSFCDAYRYDGNAFRQTASWVKADPPAEQPEAERALFDFLFALYNREYCAAAYYYAGTETTDRDQNGNLLEQSCTAAGSRCWIPQEITLVSQNSAIDLVSYRVVLYTLESDDTVNAVLRVERTPDGWKVLDLPPGPH